MKTYYFLIVLMVLQACTKSQPDDFAPVRRDAGSSPFSDLDSSVDDPYRLRFSVRQNRLFRQSATLADTALEETTKQLNVSGMMNLQPEVVSGFARYLGFEDHIRMAGQMIKEYRALPRSSRGERALSTIELVLHDYIKARYRLEDGAETAVRLAGPSSHFINVPSDAFVDGLFSLLSERPLLGIAAMLGVLFFVGCVLSLLFRLLEILVNKVWGLFRKNGDNPEASAAIHSLSTDTRKVTETDSVEKQLFIDRHPAESWVHDRPNDSASEVDRYQEQTESAVNDTPFPGRVPDAAVVKTSSLRVVNEDLDDDLCLEADFGPILDDRQPVEFIFPRPVYEPLGSTPEGIMNDLNETSAPEAVMKDCQQVADLIVNPGQEYETEEREELYAALKKMDEYMKQRETEHNAQPSMADLVNPDEIDLLGELLNKIDSNEVKPTPLSGHAPQLTGMPIELTIPTWRSMQNAALKTAILEQVSLYPELSTSYHCVRSIISRLVDKRFTESGYETVLYMPLYSKFKKVLDELVKAKAIRSRKVKHFHSYLFSAPKNKSDHGTANTPTKLVAYALWGSSSISEPPLF